MNWTKVRTIMVKEWLDTFRNKMVFFTLVFMPLCFTILPLINLYVMSAVPSEGMEEDLGPFLAYQEYFHLDNLETVMVGMASVYMIIYLVLPLMLPMMIACDSIVSEKVGKSLEPLLATPISVSELLVGKALAAVLPAVGATWLSYAVYVGLAAVLLGRPAVVAALVSPDWLSGIGLLAPLLGLLAVSVGIIVSSRVSDTRAAQQIGGFLVLPLFLTFIPMFLGGFILTAPVFLIGAAIVGAIDLATLRLAAALFRRETILTRWK